MSAHTPAPWTADLTGMDAVVVASDGRKFKLGDILYHDENKANARLIAAAPDLLLCLGDLLTAEKLLDDDDPALISVRDRARRIIAKAEGR